MPTRHKEPRTPFQAYLTLLGDNEAARRFKVSPRGAKAWRLGDRTPRANKAREIVQTDPMVRLDDIYYPQV